MNIINQLKNYSVATIHEALDQRNALDYRIKPLDPSLKLCGRALTVKCLPVDNLAIIKAVHDNV